MDIAKKNRTELKAYFVKNAIPTESNFADLIDAVLSQKEDGLAKPAGNPLSIEATGDASSLRKAINFYESFTDANPAWSISLNPRVNPADATTAKPGFAVSDPGGNNRLFIDRSSGSVGIGTITPKATLDVNGAVVVEGGLQAGNSDLYFTNPNHNHTGFGNTAGYAAIENGANYGGLMILGRTVSTNPLRRVVKIWDYLEMNGDMNVIGRVTAANSDIYFTNPSHNHTGFGNTAGYAAIENDGGQYGALMILGRAGTDQGRKVKLWDYLEVHSGGGAVISIGQFKGIKYTAGDGIRGTPNLWLDAAGKVLIKAGFGTDAMDIAERFQTEGPVGPGDVLVFDPEAGAVRLCDQQGDARVIGIASGEPGFILGLKEEDVPVALCGRVPCKVDADPASISVGDLLMTSTTKGHAQKVIDLTKSAGKIIGKALAPLTQGKGEIPVLVFLH